MSTDPILDRARKLAAMLIADGPEASMALKRLERLALAHPSVRYLLPTKQIPFPMKLVEIEIGDPGPGGERLLRELCFRFELAMGYRKGLAVLRGRHADLEEALRWYHALIPSLHALIDEMAVAWLNHAHLPEPIPRSPEPPEIEDADEEAVDIPEDEIGDDSDPGALDTEADPPLYGQIRHPRAAVDVEDQLWKIAKIVWAQPNRRQRRQR